MMTAFHLVLYFDYLCLCVCVLVVSSQKELALSYMSAMESMLQMLQRKREAVLPELAFSVPFFKQVRFLLWRSLRHAWKCVKAQQLATQRRLRDQCDSGVLLLPNGNSRSTACAVPLCA